MLRHKQIEWYEKQPNGGYGSLAWWQQVPAGNLPTLEHNGVVLTDSEVIAEYLEEIWPETAMQAKHRYCVHLSVNVDAFMTDWSRHFALFWLGRRSDRPKATAFDQLQQRLDQCGQLDLKQHQLSASRLWLVIAVLPPVFHGLTLSNKRLVTVLTGRIRSLGLRHHLESFQAVKDEYALYTGHHPLDGNLKY